MRGPGRPIIKISRFPLWMGLTAYRGVVTPLAREYLTFVKIGNKFPKEESRLYFGSADKGASEVWCDYRMWSMPMFIIEKYAYVLVPAVLAVAISACGGGSGQEGTNSSPAAVTGVSVSTGPITGFGSVFVNGVEYDTSQAQVQVNGVPGTADDLRVGMIVDVTGSVASDGITGSAAKIDFHNNVQGVVDSVDAAGNSLVVMGQTVVVDDLIVFDGATLATLQPGNIVEVSGMVDSNGALHATRIELKSTELTSNTLLELKGTVANLDVQKMTFDIGAQTVDYTTAVLKDLPAGLSDGMKVEVKSTQGFNTDGVLIAAIVEAEYTGRVSTEETGVKEIEGLVTDFTSAGDFSVNGQAVSTVDQTQYKNGSPSDIALNSRLEVEGRLNDAGVLVAAKVIFKPYSKIDITADVQDVDTSAGTLTILGVQFTVDANTQYQDESAGRVHDFRIKDIAVGDRLEIRAYKSGDTLVAARIERKNPSSSAGVLIRASLAAVNAPDLQVLGITVVADGSTAYFIHEDVSVTADAFFAAVQVGDSVKISGTLSGDGTIQATRIERDI